PTAGAMTLNGIDVTAGQFVTAAELADSQLVFTPAANANGNGYASFTFQVQDDGGTENGGINRDPTANTITFNVTPVNDAPDAVNDSYMPIQGLHAEYFGYQEGTDGPNLNNLTRVRNFIGGREADATFTGT